MSDTAKSALAAAHPNTAALLPGVDFLQGAKDFAAGVIANLEAGAAAITNVKIPGVTDTSGFGTLKDLQSAAAKIREIKGDVDKKDIQEGIADGVDLFKLTMAALDRYSIPYVKLVAGVAKLIPNLHATGVDKPA